MNTTSKTDHTILWFNGNDSLNRKFRTRNYFLLIRWCFNTFGHNRLSFTWLFWINKLFCLIPCTILFVETLFIRGTYSCHSIHAYFRIYITFVVLQDVHFDYHIHNGHNYQRSLPISIAMTLYLLNGINWYAQLSYHGHRNPMYSLHYDRFHIHNKCYGFSPRLEDLLDLH